MVNFLEEGYRESERSYIDDDAFFLNNRRIQTREYLKLRLSKPQQAGALLNGEIDNSLLSQSREERIYDPKIPERSNTSGNVVIHHSSFSALMINKIGKRKEELSFHFGSV
jgi:hypothetical protein